MPKTCIILGSSGHARVLIDTLQLLPEIQVMGILTPSIELVGTEILSIPVLGNDELLQGLRAKGVEYFVLGVGGAGDNLPRKRLFELAKGFGLKPLTVQHPSAIISRTAIVGEGCQLLAGCIVNTGACLGIDIIVNSGVIIEHDCAIGDHVHVASGARLAGAVHVGEGAHIGAGATIRQCLQIGRYALVGAGAVVIKDVSENTTVVGVPAKVLTKVLL